MENNKFLPVKIFQKRKSDERRREGSGGNQTPKWLLNEEELIVRSEEFANTLSSTAELLKSRTQEYTCVPAILSIEIEDDAIAKSHRKEIKKIFNVNRKFNIIGFSGEKSIIAKIENIADISLIEKNIKSIRDHRLGLSAMTNMTKYTPCIEDGFCDLVSNNDICKISLIDCGDYSLNSSVKLAFLHLASELSIDIREIYYSPNKIIYRANGVNSSNIEELISFATIESISFMPKYKVVLDDLSSQDSIPIKQPIDGIEYPTVGILDTGISAIPHLSPWLCNSKHSSYPKDLINNSHGTFVAGVLLYGDQLEAQPHTGLNGCRIFDATVFPDTNKETITEDELIENIRDAISSNPTIKIWNLSLGSREEADTDRFSDMGIALDDIQDEYEVLICKSAGNCTNFTSNRPISRISKSADSIRALVVGSIAHKKNNGDLADINAPSPFSRIGLGPANILKPELVSYGGNAGIVNGRITETGVSSFSPSGNAASAVGTSFSTPRVTALMAELCHNIEEEFNPLLLKGLAIHSAHYPANNIPLSERQRYYGFGLPANASNIIFNNPHEITLIQQDTIAKGEFIEILEFPFPDNMIDEYGYFHGEIKITLVTSPILHESQGSEYCQSNIDVFFGTYDKICERDISKPNILNEFGPDGNENILKQSIYSKKHLKNSSLAFTSERTLINYGKKYQPIKKWAINLDEMTATNKENMLKAPKKWYLKLTGLYRDFCESFADKNNEELSQDFCLIITIKDPTQKTNVYDTVTRLLGARNFIHSDIKLRERVHTTVDIQ